MHLNNELNIDTLIYAIHELICGEIEYSRILNALNDQGIPAYTNGINNTSTGNVLNQPIPIHPLFYTRSIPHLAHAHNQFASKLNTNKLSLFLTNSQQPSPLINLIHLIESIAVHFIELVNQTCVFYIEYSAGFHIAIKIWQTVVNDAELSGNISTQLFALQGRCLVCDHIDDTKSGNDKLPIIDFDSLLNSPVQRITRYALLWTSIQKAWATFAASSFLFNTNDPDDFSSLDKRVSISIDQAIFKSNQLALSVDWNRDIYDKVCRSYLFWSFASPPQLTHAFKETQNPETLSPSSNPIHLKIDTPSSVRNHARAKSMDSSGSQFFSDQFTAPSHIGSCYGLEALNPDSNMIISGLTCQCRNKALDSIYQWWNQDRSTCPDLIHADHTKMLNADSLSLIISTGMFVDQDSFVSRPPSVAQNSLASPSLGKESSVVEQLTDLKIHTSHQSPQSDSLSTPTLHGSIPGSKSSRMWHSISSASRDSPATLRSQPSGPLQMPVKDVEMRTYYAFLLFNDGTLVAAVPANDPSGLSRSDSSTSLDRLVVSRRSSNVLSVKYHIKHVWQLFGSATHTCSVHELVDQHSDYKHVEQPTSNSTSKSVFFGLRLRLDTCELDMYSRSPNVRSAWISAFQTLFRSRNAPHLDHGMNQDLTKADSLLEHHIPKVAQIVLKTNTLSTPCKPVPNQSQIVTASPVIDQTPEVGDLRRGLGTLRPRSLTECDASLTDPSSSVTLIPTTPDQRKSKSSLNFLSEIARVVSRRSRSSSVVSEMFNKEYSLDIAFASIFSYVSGQNTYPNNIPRSHSSTSITDSGHWSPPSQTGMVLFPENGQAPTGTPTIPSRINPIIRTTWPFVMHSSTTEAEDQSTAVPSADAEQCPMMRCQSCTAHSLLDSKDTDLVNTSSPSMSSPPDTSVCGSVSSTTNCSPPERFVIPTPDFARPSSPSLSPFGLITYKIATKVKRASFIAF